MTKQSSCQPLVIGITRPRELEVRVGVGSGLAADTATDDHHLERMMTGLPHHIVLQGRTVLTNRRGPLRRVNHRGVERGLPVPNIKIIVPRVVRGGIIVVGGTAMIIPHQ